MSFICFAQEEEEMKYAELNDISKTSKVFKSAFFDALSNRAVGKYDKAIINIDQCLKIDNSKPVLYYEIAQSEIALRLYDSAEENLNEALRLMPNSELILKSLSQVYFVKQKFDKRISTLRRLSELNSKYKYNLAQAYRYTQQYGEALEALNSYQREYSYDWRIKSLKNQIYTSSKDKLPVIVDLEKELLKNPKNERAYVQLIDVYKKNNEEGKVQKTVHRFREAMPYSPMLEYINFQEYLDRGDTVKATESMRKITAVSSISDEIKKKVLNDFKIFGKQNPNYEKSLDSLSISSKASINKDENLKFIMELSTVNIKQGTTESLLNVYQNNLGIDSNNYDLIKDTLLLQLYYGKLNKAKELVNIGIEKYPSQPFLYLIKGTLLVKEEKHTKAINNFKDGLDYIVDNQELERALYLKLAKSYEAIGDLDKAKKYQNKGEKIEISTK
mgnify:CR=1 FL=1